jgi:hypothetical protein
MRESIFQRLPEVINESMMKRMRKYDRFLYGNAMINQKESKQIGQEITYFEIIKNDGLNTEYKPIYDILEKD